jgi:hypothetical protein
MTNIFPGSCLKSCLAARRRETARSSDAVNNGVRTIFLALSKMYSAAVPLATKPKR